MEFLAMNKINLPGNQSVSQSITSRQIKIRHICIILLSHTLQIYCRKNKKMFLEYFMYIINITSFAAPQDSTA